ncbi:hypothetical protein B0H14DRAFT_2603672 [Mycena olivaceomarginata]|nr:hypothetical protein B0H14DRAFT_2603672 [Mycena olivaceomarginata]
MDPTADWTQTYLPTTLLGQFPEFTTLRLTEDWRLLIQLQAYIELELDSYVPPPRSGLVARLRRVQPIVTEEESDDGFFTVHQRAPLELLRTVHIRYPEYNPPILALLAPPVLVHLTLMEAEAASQVIHTCLRAAGPRIRTLVLDFWRDSPITQLATRLTTGLAYNPYPCTELHLISITARLLGCVLDAPQLKEPTVEAEVEYGDGTGAGQRMAGWPSERSSITS